MVRLVAFSVCVGASVSVLLAGPENRQPPQQEKPNENFRVEDLLEIDFESQRKDAFARATAVAKRYEGSSIRGFETATSELDAYCKLSEPQRRKLQLAVRGAAKRASQSFQQEVDATASIKSHEEAYTALAGLFSRMQTALAAPTQSSFWQNVVRKTLTAEQSDLLKKNRQARTAFLKEAWVMDVVRETDRYARLQFDQRTRLRARLTDWVRGNELPELKRSYRGPWKYVRHGNPAAAILDELDERRRTQLIKIAPQDLRDELAALRADDKKHQGIWIP